MQQRMGHPRWVYQPEQAILRRGYTMPVPYVSGGEMDQVTVFADMVIGRGRAFRGHVLGPWEASHESRTRSISSQDCLGPTHRRRMSQEETERMEAGMSYRRTGGRLGLEHGSASRLRMWKVK